MEDLENLASKKLVRAVSSRHLYRNAADLLDEIEDEGHSILIVRYGRPTAILTPSPDTSQGRASVSSVEVATTTESRGSSTQIRKRSHFPTSSSTRRRSMSFCTSRIGHTTTAP